MATVTLLEPQPKQREFMTSKVMFTGYGGAKGGGKSWALRNLFEAKCLKYPGINCLLMRQTYKDVYENQIQFIEQDLRPFLELKGSARVIHNQEKHAFLFPNGSRLKYGYCACDNDLKQYQGMSYDLIGIDEATQFTYDVFLTLAATLRGGIDQKGMFLTCNPGGIGHEWVKRIFVDGILDEGQRKEDFKFIRALASDNMFNGEHYFRMLDQYPEPLRSAYRDGDWNTYIGQFFPEWDNEKLTVDPFPIPPYWTISMAIDYGLDTFAPVWIATDENGVDYIFQGLEYVNMLVRDAAEVIKETEIKFAVDDRRIRRFAPPDLFNRNGQTGESVIDKFAREGISFLKSDNNREAGWLSIKDRLATGQLKIFRNNAPELCRNMRLLQYDIKNPNDAETQPHGITHSPDALRYYCVQRKRTSTKPVEVRKQDRRYMPEHIITRKNAGKIQIKPAGFMKGYR